MPTSTNNAGTITGVTGSDGLTGSGTSGSVTIKHAAPSTSPATTTSALYPITIDKYGHITAKGTAVTSMTPSSHTHGNIQNGGTLQTNDITIANGDKLIVTDSSDSSKIARTSISFDASTATKALTQKGT